MSFILTWVSHNLLIDERNQPHTFLYGHLFREAGITNLKNTMKKVLLAAATILMAATISASAQNYEKNIFGVRAGLNITNANMKSGFLSLDTKARVGFYVGGVYQRLLTKSIPLYLETGLNVSQYGTAIDLGSMMGGMTGGMMGEALQKVKCGLWYLQVPVMVNYKFFISDFTLYPSLGLVYSLGLGGKAKMGGESMDMLGEGGLFKRSDFGMRIALNGEWKRFYAGLQYGFGFLNLAQTSEYGDAIKIHNNCTFTISVGYNF